jgi:hypothetical protein
MVIGYNYLSIVKLQRLCLFCTHNATYYSISCSYGQVNFERGVLSLIIHFDLFFSCPLSLISHQLKLIKMLDSTAISILFLHSFCKTV